jgi:hypothetical protein
MTDIAKEKLPENTMKIDKSELLKKLLTYKKDITKPQVIDLKEVKKVDRENEASKPKIRITELYLG